MPNFLIDFLIYAIPVASILALLWSINWLLLTRHKHLGNERKFPRQIIMIALAFIGLLTIIFLLPITEGSRNQLLGLTGLLVSGLIAFSSTSITSNLMAGILLRITSPFKIGDFIRVADYFGRVSERGMFDVEIQTESSELVTIPNTLLITHAVTTIQSSGTIISATLSLGYDLHHLEAEEALISAAKQCGLEDAFVHILELGDFSVTYRLSGVLKEVKKMITARSNLYQCILDNLHNRGIEIMSPNIMSQRRLEEGEQFIPTTRKKQKKRTVSAEDIAFDKAESAELLEQEKQTILDDIKKLEDQLEQDQKSDQTAEQKADSKDRINHQIDELKDQLKQLASTRNDVN